MGNAATAKKGNEQESGEQIYTDSHGRRRRCVMLAAVQHELAVRGGRKPLAVGLSTVGNGREHGIAECRE